MYSLVMNMSQCSKTAVDMTPASWVEFGSHVLVIKGDLVICNIIINHSPYSLADGIRTKDGRSGKGI